MMNGEITEMVIHNLYSEKTENGKGIILTVCNIGKDKIHTSRNINAIIIKIINNTNMILERYSKMELLKEKILKEGSALNEHILKVDSFLNHQVDTNLINEIGKEFANHFKDKKIDKVVTIESSGIAPAFATASCLNVPMVILKKQHSSILNNDLYETTVHSFTKNADYTLTASKKFLNENENILIIDDFLANGEAVLGASRILSMAKCNIVGIGIVIEKTFQSGRKKVEDAGFDIYSLARISKLREGIIEFI